VPMDQNRRRPPTGSQRRRPRRSLDVRRHAVVDRRPDGTWTVAVPPLGLAVSGRSEPEAWAALHPAITALVDDPEGRRRLEAFAADHAEDATDEAIDLSVTDALGPIPRIDAETLGRAVDAGDPLLVVFWSDLGRACRDLGPELVALGEELAGRAQLARLNVEEHPEAAAAHRVRGLPTVVLFRHGQEARRIVGVRPSDELLALLEPALP
jgi:thiol-disulfide isomerase/thioredoxin